MMNALAFQEVALPNMLMVKFPRLTFGIPFRVYSGRVLAFKFNTLVCP